MPAKDFIVQIPARLLKDRSISADVRLGRAIRIPSEEIERLLAEGLVPARKGRR